VGSASSTAIPSGIREPFERHIDEYLKADPFSLAHALERLRRAIHYEELERRDGEDWSIAKEYVRSLLRRMT